MSRNDIKKTSNLKCDFSINSRRFIKNEGQYGDTVSGFGAMGKILFAYEGLDMPVLFTSKGIIHLHRSVKGPTPKEKENLERMGIKEEVIAQKLKVEDRIIAMEWLNANGNSKVVFEMPREGFHTYGFLDKKARAFGTIIYENLYPGIDLILDFDTTLESGFRYNLKVKAFADPGLVKMRYYGDLTLIKKDRKGRLLIESELNGINVSAPLTYYTDGNRFDVNKEIISEFTVENHIVSFSIPSDYDHSKTIYIDPFVSATSNLTGANASKAKDVDFDYAGNVFVAGGGDGSVYKLAKFNSSGTLQWTFSGALTVPSWTFGTYYGGWVVDKSTGNTYLGQGFAPGGGFRVIRLNTSGTYDNFITTANASFLEDWKMIWSCNNGSPQIIIAGGGTNSNINLGICSPPATTISGVNITGIPYAGGSGWAQDISDIIIDPVNSDMFTIYGSLFGTPGLSNKIYKNSAPYSASTMAWNVSSGYTSIQEIANRPYLVAGQIDNSSNVFAVNSSYFFYWDGRNLKAFNKSTGAAVGSALVLTGNTVLMQGGIVADECNNVFIGSASGTIKAYTFNGTSFNDSTPDITITGFTSKSIYDLVYSDATKTLYACGDGFVAAYDISSYGCKSNVYTLSVTSGCVNQTASGSISPAPPSGSTVTYVLYNGSALVGQNSTGIFTALSPNTFYSMHAFVNQSCSGVETVKNFQITGPVLSVTKADATCGNADGSISASATGGTGSLKFSIDGVNYQSSGSFTGIASGLYTLTVKDSLGCSSSSTYTIVNSNGPTLSISKTDAFCGTGSGSFTLTGSAGKAPYTYSLNGGSYSGSNVFSNLSSGLYTIRIKDSNACVNSYSQQINNTGSTTVRSLRANTSCGNNNGSLTVNVSGGTSPYQYSINSGTYQTGNVFTGLTAGVYTVTVKDSSNCINSITDTIKSIVPPKISTSVFPTSCTGSSGGITIAITGGTAPFQYSSNGGVTFQSGNAFTGLTAGTYSVTVKDVNGCISNSSAVVTLTSPQITDTTTLASCTVKDGTIRAIGTGGTLPYQYSINGTTFQSGNLFTGLGTGTYTLTIKDSVGCTNTVQVVVNSASGLKISATALATSCASSSGKITLTGLGGLAPLRYSINGTNYFNSGVFNSLAAGTYACTVKDSNGCIASVSIRVNADPGPTVSVVPTSSSCNNSNGMLTASAGSGKVPYLYSINGTTFQSSNVFSGLSSGSYTVTVKDSNLCTSTASVTISNVGGGTGPTVTAVTTDAECFQANGKIDANGSGGKNPKRYSIDGVNFQGSTTFNNVPPGTYTVYVIDDNGCTNTVKVTVGNVLGPQVSAVDSPSVCGGSTGKLILTGFNGTAPYKYSKDGGVNFQNSNIFTGLSAGFYTITVRDAANVCHNSIVVKVGNSNGPSISASKTDASCAAHNGKITASGSGGSGTLKYSIDGINYQSGKVFTGLAPGQYAVYAKDSTGCVSNTTLTIGDIKLPTVSATSTMEKCGKANGVITCTGSAGTTPYRYSIDGTTFKSGNTFSGLNAGNYTVTLKDTNDCIATTNLTITNIAGPQMSKKMFNATCGKNNGTLLIAGRSGTMPYTYSRDGVNYQNSFLFPYLSSGTYYLSIKDANDCKAFDTAVILQKSAPAITTLEDTTGCGPGRASLIVNVSGGTAPYQYSADSITFQNSNKFPCILAGNYHVVVKDSNTCTAYSNILLNGTTLAVTLLNFDAVALEDKVDLIWTTAAEINSAYFTVEHSANGLAWDMVGQHAGAGNSNVLLNYLLADMHPYSGLSYYRLKQTDLNGKSAYSETRTVFFGNATDVKLSPNPASNQVVIELSRPRKAKFEMTNTLGQHLEVPFHNEAGKIVVDTSHLVAGIYYIHLESGGFETTRKLVLIKD